MTFISVAKWPKGTMGGYNNDVSKDVHDSIEAARAVNNFLHKHGLGGAGKLFPEKTWVEDENGNVILPDEPTA